MEIMLSDLRESGDIEASMGPRSFIRGNLEFPDGASGFKLQLQWGHGVLSVEIVSMSL